MSRPYHTPIQILLIQCGARSHPKSMQRTTKKADPQNKIYVASWSYFMVISTGISSLFKTVRYLESESTMCSMLLLFLTLTQQDTKISLFRIRKPKFYYLKRIAFHLSFVIQLLVFHSGYLRCTGIKKSTHLMFIHILLNQKRHGSLGVRTKSFFLPPS